jgi:glycosyltransferase involved in cell wall biosynthesis
LKHSDAVISISEEEETILKSTFSSVPKSKVISNIYDDFGNGVSCLQDSIYDFVFVGNFLHLPNIEAVEYIFSSLAPNLPNHKFAIVGGGASDDFVAEHSLANILWLGPVNDLSAVYAKSKSVIAPLVSGAGVKGKVLEALNFGVPVIGSAIAWEGIPLPDNYMGSVAIFPHEYLDAITSLEQIPVRSLSSESVQKLNSKFGSLSASTKLVEIMEL